jgi:hypothetical protein
MRKRKKISEIKNIDFISTRIAGTDGVSLETEKWAEVLEEMGYVCFYFAGELDTPKERSMLSPKAHFRDPKGFNVIEMDDCLREVMVSDVIDILQNKARAQVMTDHNYRLAK